MSEEIFSKGFDKMSASEHRLWLADIASGAFKILPESGVVENNLDESMITEEEDWEPEGVLMETEGE